MLAVEPIRVTAAKGFRYGYFLHSARCRVDANSAKPRRPNCPGFGFEEDHGHSGHRGAGDAANRAIGHKWQVGTF